MRRVLETLPPDQAGEVAICLVSDRKMREFNRRYRERDAPTDVLSFPGDDTDAIDERRYLGDIAISVDTAARQARERNHALDRELEVLALHGYLHLLGFDHERDAGEMMRVQRRLERSLTTRPGKPATRRRA
jgi:probable rRNA maturation factor